MVSVGGFAGFVCTKRLIRAKKKDAVSKIPGFVWIGPKAVELGLLVSNQCFVIGFRYDLRK